MSTPEGSSAWDSLIDELERVKRERLEAQSECNRLRNGHGNLTRQRDVARAAFAKYGQHIDDCPRGGIIQIVSEPCTCGLATALGGS